MSQSRPKWVLLAAIAGAAVVAIILVVTLVDVIGAGSDVPAPIELPESLQD